MRKDEGQHAVRGNLKTPAVANSDLPGLLGFNALRANKAVLDFSTLRMHFCGPGDLEVERTLPPGSETFQLEVAPSGHLVLPCCEYNPTSSSSGLNESSLTLITSNNSGSQSAEAVAQGAAQQQTGIPPPPSNPPLLPETARREIVLPALPASDC